MVGWFDPQLRPEAWFDPEVDKNAWFDRELIAAVAAAQAPLPPPAHITLQAVNRASTF